MQGAWSRRRCRGTAVAAAVTLAAAGAPALAQDRATIGTLVDSLTIYVEGSGQLKFRHPTRYAVQQRAQVERYLERQMDRPVAAERLRARTVAYNLFGLVPDTIIRRREMVRAEASLLRGYYDPEVDTLFIVAGSPREELPLVVSHEMVHAAQGQYVDLAALLDRLPDDDAQLAARMIIEGHATFASFRLRAGGRNVVGYTGFWNYLVLYLKLDPSLHPNFRKIPLITRENLLGPYVYGTQFMSWWQGWEFAEGLPLGERMPRSTEQVLHPARYADHDEPLPLVFADADAGVLAEGVLGEFEIHVLGAHLAGASRLENPAPLGWAGDRYRVYAGTAGRGPALVWYVAWDDLTSAAAFADGVGRQLAARQRPGYRARLDTLMLGGRVAHRYVFAPERWERWEALPMLGVVGAP